MRAWFILWAAYRWTGDPKYVQPFVDSPIESMQTVNADTLDMLDMRKSATDPLIAAASRVRPSPSRSNETSWQLAWQATGDTSYLDKVYASQIQTAHEREFINTPGQPLDRPHLLQQRRAAALAPRRRRAHAQLLLSRQRSELAIRRTCQRPERRDPRTRGHARSRQDHRLQSRSRSRHSAHDRLGSRSRPVDHDAGHAAGNRRRAPTRRRAAPKCNTQTVAFERSKAIAITSRRTRPPSSSSSSQPRARPTGRGPISASILKM